MLRVSLRWHGGIDQNGKTCYSVFPYFEKLFFFTMIPNSTWSKRRDRCEINENEPIMETNRQLVQFRIRRRH